MSAIVMAYMPIYKVRLDYIVRRGRTWSALEHMVLWKLSQGRMTSGALAEMADVPLRLIVECLIELMDAGWVDVHTGSQAVAFEATSSGKKAADLKKLPEDTRSLRRRTTLCMDRILGGFYVPEDLTIVHKDKLPENAIVLRPRWPKTVPTPASIDRLYMRDDETFQEWVDNKIMARGLFAIVQGSHLDSLGLPEYRPPELASTILQEISSMAAPEGEIARVDASSGFELPLQTDGGYAITDVEPTDLIVGGSAHLEAVSKILAEAKSFVLIHTCFVAPGAVRRLLPAMQEAAKRNVTIDLLWGQRAEWMDEQSKKEFAEVTALFAALPYSARSKIRFADKETGSHAKIILADCGNRGAYEALVGSCNWLSSNYKSVEVSIRIREPRVLGTIASILAQLRIPSYGKWTSDVYRLSQIRARCLAAPPKREGHHRVAVIRDREHLAAVREARDTAVSAIFAACDLLGPAGETSVFVPMREAARSGISISLAYNNLARSISDEQRIEAEKALAAKGVALLAAKNVHGKFLAWDADALVISSFNWLATTPDPWKPQGAEIGVLVKGPGLVRELIAQFLELLDRESRARIEEHWGSDNSSTDMLRGLN